MAIERRLVFGGVADLYDRARPSYPEAMIDDVIAYAGEPRALEVGAGTGKATILFAQRGVHVHALEPSAAMAELAAANCAGYVRVSIEQSDFEHFVPGARRFPLLYSAQAWHWVTPEVRYVKAREVLQPGGALAVFWNRPRWDASPLRAGIEEIYERMVPEFGADPGPMHPATANAPRLWGDWEREIGAVKGFAQPETRTYHRDVRYTTGEYLQLLQTHSDHIMLGPERQGALLGEIGTLIDRHGGSMAVRYETRLCLARAGLN